MNTLVVARYNEDLTWILEVPETFKIIIYNKGDAISDQRILSKSASIIARPNVGRESETYLNHMLTAVPDDEHFTAFVQGGVQEHSPDIIDLLKDADNWKDIQALSWCWRTDRNIPPASLLEDYAKRIAGKPKCRPEYFSLTQWGPIDFADAGASGMGMVYRILHQLPETTNIASHMLNRANLIELAKEAENHKIGVFAYGAVFGVRNHLIKQVPPQSLEFFKGLSTSGVACYGYILERLWLHLFGQKFQLPVDHS